MEKINRAYMEALLSLDRLVRGTAAEHKKIADEFDEAKEAWTSTPKNVPSWDHVGHSRKALAEARFHELDSSIQGRIEKIWSGFDGEKRRIRQQLAHAIAEAETLDAGGIDQAAISLLNSGLMKSGDYARMAEQYSENPTVLALLRQSAAKYADSVAADTLMDESAATRERVAVLNVVQNAKTGGQKTLESFDNWLSSVNTLACRDAHGNFYSRENMIHSSLADGGWDALLHSCGVSFEAGEKNE